MKGGTQPTGWASPTVLNPPAQHDEWGVPPSTALLAAGRGDRLKGEFLCKWHSKGWGCRGAPCAGGGSLLGPEHPSCSRGLGAQQCPMQGSVPSSPCCSLTLSLCWELESCTPPAEWFPSWAHGGSPRTPQQAGAAGLSFCRQGCPHCPLLSTPLLEGSSICLSPQCLGDAREAVAGPDRVAAAAGPEPHGKAGCHSAGRHVVSSARAVISLIGTNLSQKAGEEEG